MLANGGVFQRRRLLSPATIERMLQVLTERMDLTLGMPASWAAGVVLNAATDFFGLHHAHISVLAVTAAAEGTGVGNSLIAHAEQWAAARGFTVVTLNVFAENARARRLYERNGFEPEVVKYAKPL